MRTLGALLVVMAVLTGIMFAQGRSTPKLGLDLAGGTSVTLTAKTENGKTPSGPSMDKAVEIINARVNGLGISSATVTKQGNDNIVVSIPGANEAQSLATIGTTAKMQFRTAQASGSPTATPICAAGTSSGSSTATPKASASSTPKAGVSAGATPKGRALSSALTAAASPTPTPGTSGATASPKASAAPTGKSTAKAGAGATPTASATPTCVTVAEARSELGLPTAVTDDDIKTYLTWTCNKKSTPPGSTSDTAAYVTSCDQDGTAKYLLGPVNVKGEEIKSASAQPPNVQNGGSASWTVSMNFKSKGADQFYKATQTASAAYQASSSAPQSQIAIVLDGKIVSAPQISNGPISGGSAQIYGGSSGGFTQKEASDLANVLSYGALPLQFVTSSTTTLSSSLGSDQLNGGLLAGAIGLALVVLYSLLYYQGLGVVSILSLAVASAMTWLAVVILGENVGFRLSLEHIVGLIVSIGITADSFIVYFERLRDELREGRPLRPSVEKAWVRARRTILVADAVTFIAAVVLYVLAVGEVAGFAFAMGLTTLIDVIVVFFFTKPMVALLARLSFFNRGHKLSGLSAERLRKSGPARPAATTGQEA